MPCCAFAAFILSQVVLGFGALKRFVLRSDDAFDDAGLRRSMGEAARRTIRIIRRIAGWSGR